MWTTGRCRPFDGVSFDVHRGEFFGIVGRERIGQEHVAEDPGQHLPGDSGSVRTAGRLAPFIELGVGFNPELNARDNALLNGVLMGLSQA